MAPTRTPGPPRVTVCIPAYNHGEFLADALESALAQSYGDIEVVVSDNRSTDNTREVVERFQQRDPRVRYELAPTHTGMQENFNRCLQLARGEYVKFLCADDVLESACVERMLAVLADRPGVRLIACARRAFRDDGSRGQILRYAQAEVDCAGEDAIRRCYYHGNLIGEPSAVMFRRRDAGDGFSGRYAQLVDLDMWFRLLEGGRFVFVPETLCGIRAHDAQATRASLASGRVTADKSLLFADYSAKPYLRGTALERLLWDFRLAWSGERERAAGHVAQATRGAVYFPGLHGPMTAAARIAGAVRGL